MTSAASKQVGSTRLSLPAFGFGSAHLGELYAKVDEADSRATMDAAWAAGVRYYDTAPWYGRGLSEHRLGGFLRTKPRSEFKITTKVGRTLHRPKDPATFDRSPWTGGLNFEVLWDYSYDGIMRSYAQALQRLALDTVDALVIHDLDAEYQGERFAQSQKEIRDVRRQSAAGAQEVRRHPGLWHGHQFRRRAGDGGAAGRARFLPRRHALHVARSAQPASRHGGATASAASRSSSARRSRRASWSPAPPGQPTMPMARRRQRCRHEVRGIEAVCKAHNVALPAAALQFVLAHPIVVSVIPGAAKPSEVTQNVANVDAPIPAGFWSDLKAQKLIDPRLTGSGETLMTDTTAAPIDDMPLIAARGISKSFAAIEVLRDVDLDLRRGEIHALLGENGAGKSTFAKILAGVHRPTRGTLALNGTPVEVPNPIAAQKLGITLIHQEPISFPDLSVAENLVLGRTGGSPLGRVPWAEITRDARRLMDLLGVKIEVSQPMRGLSIADQQMVEIARALASDSRLIIMDEPTAPLTPKEVETLFIIARRLRDEGRTIIFISAPARGSACTLRPGHHLPRWQQDRHRRDQEPHRRRHHPTDDRPAAARIHAQAGHDHRRRGAEGRQAHTARRLQRHQLRSPQGRDRRARRPCRRRPHRCGPRHLRRGASGKWHGHHQRQCRDDQRSVAGHRARSRVRARGPRRGRHLPHTVGAREHHRRRAAPDRAGRRHPPRGGKGAGHRTR